MNLSRVFLYSSALTMIANHAIAKYCVKLPTCEELGYIYSADKYPNNRSIKCPFDTKKILLLDYCQAYGLTSCDSTSGECDECIVEKADGTKSNSGYWRYTRCNAGYSYKSGECPPTEVDTSKYPFTQGELNEEIGEIECVQSAQNTYCGYKSCNEGWDPNGGNCIVHDCGSAYPYTSCDTNGTCGECKSGEHTKYSAPTCNNGWYTSGSACVENDCSAFTSATSSITGCSSSSSCLSGTKTTYKCDTCYIGYEVVNGVCNKTCTYTKTSKPSNCATATGSCQLGSASGTTTYYATTCSTCNNGYEVSSGSCVAAACTGFNSASSTIANCTTTSSCQKGATKVYKCESCASGFEPDGSGGCKESCAYTNTSLPTGCLAADTCSRGGITYYSSTCNTCYTGYSLSSGKCNKTCTYTKTSKPSNCKTASSCQRGSASGTKTYYSSSCSTCNDGWTVSGGTCVAAACSGYGTSTSNCTNYSTCKSGNTTKYKCTSCSSGYKTNSSGGCSYINTCGLGAGDERSTDRSTPYTDEECISLYGSDHSKAMSCQRGTSTVYYCRCDNCGLRG